MSGEDVNRGGKKSEKKLHGTKEIHAKDFEDLKKMGKTKDRRSKRHSKEDSDE